MNDWAQGQRVLEQLREQYNELAALAGALAHEIKNPLSVIRMNMDLLAEELALGDSPREARIRRKVEIVQAQCTRLEKLLNDFIRFARLGDLQLQPGNLNDVVARVLALFEPQAREENITVVPYLDPSLPGILLHPQALEAALVNLVKNAFEAMSPGGQLVVRTYVTSNGVAVDLIDDGCGIDDATALRMFEAFFSTKGSGSGLGLPTARKIVEAHGGTIHVQSAVGCGTKFTLEFPALPRIPGSSTPADSVADKETAVATAPPVAASADAAQMPH
ncbi:MAG: two-component sensor histidine kinase [Pirellulaceae bacterium]|nr:MAG: two-component sensor histidine kinase [Pirellulaceae bacterium]